MRGGGLADGRARRFLFARAFVRRVFRFQRERLRPPPVRLSIVSTTRAATRPAVSVTVLSSPPCSEPSHLLCGRRPSSRLLSRRPSHRLDFHPSQRRPLSHRAQRRLWTKPSTRRLWTKPCRRSSRRSSSGLCLRLY